MNSLFRVLWLSFMSVLGMWVSLSAEAQILSTTAKEVSVQYRASFVLGRELKTKRSLENWAEYHASHVFAFLKTSRWSEIYQMELMGVGAPQVPSKIQIVSFRTVKGPRGGKRTEITYDYTAQWILMNSLANEWIRKGTIQLPLPYDLESIYDPRCTDEHYQSLGDYWYFYDPHKAGCEYLLQSPYHVSVNARIQTVKAAKKEYRPRYDQIRGDNGNGSLFRVDIIHGFSDGPRARDDEGRKGFHDFDRELRRRGFKRAVITKNQSRVLYEYTRGSVLIRSSLVDSDSDALSNQFAKFFKEAVENADVIAYLGHSGLGGNLDIPSLESRVGDFQFQPQKAQIFYFDSCSSYSYYVAPFLNRKTRPTIDVVMNGLESYFYSGIPKLMIFLDTLISSRMNPSWLELFERMEKVADAPSSLIGVAGI